MDLGKYFDRQQPMPGFNGIEKVMAIYVLFTLALTAVFYPNMEASAVANVVFGRLAVVAVTVLLYLFYRKRPCRATYYLRVIFQVALLGYWYPDIYYLAGQMPSQDHLLAAADEAVFGCQPSIVFSQILSGPVWNELFNLGYFSYYLMIAAVVILPLALRPRRFDRVTFIVMTSFFMYYTFFILFNAAGPQFYFSCPGVDAANGVFPDVGLWFKDHDTLNHMSNVTGPFSYLIHLVQEGEKPIAAFPSSHVGASTVILLLTFGIKRIWGFIMMPFWVLLCLSTVYIGAHYAVDVPAGLISAILFIWLANKLYDSAFFHRPKGFDALYRKGHHRRHHHKR